MIFDSEILLYKDKRLSNLFGYPCLILLSVFIWSSGHIFSWYFSRRGRLEKRVYNSLAFGPDTDGDSPFKQISRIISYILSGTMVSVIIFVMILSLISRTQIPGVLWFGLLLFSALIYIVKLTK